MSSNAELKEYFIIIPRPLAKETAKLHKTKSKRELTHFKKVLKELKRLLMIRRETKIKYGL